MRKKSLTNKVKINNAKKKYMTEMMLIRFAYPLSYLTEFERQVIKNYYRKCETEIEKKWYGYEKEYEKKYCKQYP